MELARETLTLLVPRGKLTDCGKMDLVLTLPALQTPLLVLNVICVPVPLLQSSLRHFFIRSLSMKRSAVILCAAIAASTACATVQGPHGSPRPDTLPSRCGRTALPARLRTHRPRLIRPSPRTTSSPESRSCALETSSSPTLTLYAAKGNAARPAVVVFPGAAIPILAIDLEGTEVCDWLNSIDVTCGW